jgi:hypothetical protein
MAKPQRQVQQKRNSFTQQWHWMGCPALRRLDPDFGDFPFSMTFFTGPEKTNPGV